jgi:adenylate cyclase
MKLPLKLGRSLVPVTLLASLLVCATVISVRNLRGLEFLELAAYDYYLRFRPSDTGELTQTPRIVLVTVSEEDIHRQGRWPLSDRVLASLLKILGNYHPRAIGLDIYRDIPVPPGSKELEDVFSEFQNIIVTSKKVGDDKSATIPHPYMVKNMDLVGFNDIVTDRGGIVRRGLLFLDDGQTTSYSFPLLMTMLYLDAEGITLQGDKENPEYFRLGKTTFIPFESNDGGYIKADARGYQFLLDFSDIRRPFTSFSLSDVLSGKVPVEAFKDKMILIGVTAVSLKDFFFTPFNEGMESDNRISGVELHGRIVSQLLRSALEGSRPFRHMKEYHEWAWIFFWSLIGGILGLLGRSFWRFFLLGAVSVSLLLFVTSFAFRFGWWIPVVPSAISWMVSDVMVTAYILYREKVERALLMQLFSRHVSPAVAGAIWQQREQFMDGGRPRSQKLTATVLFTDLKGFTTVSEGLDPQTLMDWLNEYMESMAHIVIEHGGVINKYIGDSIMAVFGVPVARTNDPETDRDAVNAVNCALSMSERLKILNIDWRERNLPATKMRIGIYTGQLVAGSLGSAQRMEYTVIGDTVNIASRLESFDKDFEGDPGSDCRILIGDETLRRLGSGFSTEKVGVVSLKGKDEKVVIYIVTGRNENSDVA